MTFLTQLRYGVEYVALRLVIGTVRLFPLEMAAQISADTWRKLAPMGKRRHQRALDNLALAFPDKSEEEREHIALEAWSNLGRVMVETMQLDRILEQPERIEVLNSKVLGRYRNKMGPLICCSLHTGNWELATWPLIVANIEAAAVYRLVSNPFVDAYLRKQRERLYTGGMLSRGAGQLNPNAGHNTALQIGTLLREGGRVGMLADLYDRRGIEVPFFGHPASSSKFAAMLARRLGCRIWVGRSIRIGKQSRFKVEMKEIQVPFSGDSDQDIEAITASMQRQFEEWITEYPEQWMWSNRKWS